MSDAFTYEVEVLPEIEIRELVTFEELLDSMPSFVAFSQEEIFQHLAQLVQDKQKAAAFQSLFNYVKEARTKHALSSLIVPVLKTEVASVEDDDIETTAAAIYETQRAPNYQSQFEEVFKIMYPLLDVPGSFLTPVVPVTVGLENGLQKRFVLLPTDRVSHDLYGVAFRKPLVTPSSHIYERVNTHTIAPFPSQADISVGKTPEEVQIDFQEVCNQLGAVTDANSLNVHLEQYGFSLSSLNEDQARLLIQRLQQLLEDEDDTEKQSKVSATEYDSKQTAFIPRRKMWEQFEVLLKTPMTVDKFRVMWEGLAYSTQLVQPPVDIPNNAFAIATGLSENKFTLEDVVNHLKYQRTLSEYEQLRSALERFQAVSLEDSSKMIEELKQRWETIFTYYVDRAPKQFVTMYRDMAEIKEGRDDSTYMGDVREYVFEEQAIQPLAVNESDEEEDVSEVVKPKPVQYDLKNSSAGVREVLEAVLPKIESLRLSSGLPLDMDALVSYLNSTISRVSRFEYLSQAIPGLSLQVRNQIILMDMERALHMASFITPSELSTPLKEAIKQSWTAFEGDAKSVLVEAISWWVLDLQERALKRELIFDVTKGLMACVRKWSPWGPPLQNDKGEGVLEYLTCCAKETQGVWSWGADELKRMVLESVNNNPKVDDMKTRFKELGKAVLTMSEKAKAANISLGEVIENKQKSRYLPEFVKTYMLLPGLLAGSQSKMSTGCCLQKLGENYEADSDWRGVLKRLRDVKDAFAKKRMAMVEMPVYATFETETAPLETAEVHNVSEKLHIESASYFKIEAWLQSWSEVATSFVSSDMVLSVYSDANKALTQADKFVQMAVNTIGSRQKLSNVATFLREEASWAQLDQMFNIIAFTLQKESKTYQDDTIERGVLTSAIRDMAVVKRQMQKLSGIFDDVEFSLIKPLYVYIIARALCLPSVPETSSNQRLSLQSAVSTGFLAKTIKAVMDAVKQLAVASKMPSLEDQKTFITNVREKQKIEILDILDQKSVDDRQVLLDAKKLGIISLLQKPSVTDTETVEEEQNEDDDATSEFKARGQNTDDNDLDNLDDE